MAAMQAAARDRLVAAGWRVTPVRVETWGAEFAARRGEHALSVSTEAAAAAIVGGPAPSGSAAGIGSASGYCARSPPGRFR